MCFALIFFFLCIVEPTSQFLWLLLGFFFSSQRMSAVTGVYESMGLVTSFILRYLLMYGSNLAYSKTLHLILKDIFMSSFHLVTEFSDVCNSI